MSLARLQGLLNRLFLSLTERLFKGLFDRLLKGMLFMGLKTIGRHLAPTMLDETEILRRVDNPFKGTARGDRRIVDAGATGSRGCPKGSVEKGRIAMLRRLRRRPV